MDAVLKHLGPRSGFIVCHRAMIDDLLFPASSPSSPRCTPPLSAFSADLQGILNISYIYMDAGISN